jgi:hypothetical protein
MLVEPPSDAELLEGAVATWRAALVEAAGGSTLVDVELLGDAALDLSAAHPSGISQLYAGRKPAYRLPPRGVASALRLRTVRDLYGGTPAESVRYLNHPVRYDTRRATELLADAGLRCPRFPEYAPAMVDFFKQHEHDPAFAPKPTK